MGEAARAEGPPAGAAGYFVDPDCPACDEVPPPAQTVHCAACGRPHHLGCWVRNKGCGEPGCGGREARPPHLEGAPPEPVWLQRRAEPRMWLFVFVVAYVVAMYATLFLLPAHLQHSLVLTLGLGFLLGCGGLWLAQALVGRAYFFDPARGYISKETRLGPFPWGRRRVWRPFDAIRGVQVQLVRRTGGGEDPGAYVVQVWLRDAVGADLVLREEALRPDSPGLDRVLAAARLLGAELRVDVLGEDETPDLRVSRITGMPLQAPR